MFSIQVWSFNMNRRTTCLLLVPAAVLSAAFAIFSASTAPAQEGAKAAGADSAKMLIGAWRLKEAKNPGSPSGIGTRLKLFTGTHWCVIQPDPASGKIVFQHGGHYSLNGSSLSETVVFAGDSTAALIGRTFKYELKITGDALEQVDPEGTFNEKWERAKAPGSK
jgi:hypothetical protein